MQKSSPNNVHYHKITKYQSSNTLGCVLVRVTNSSDFLFEVCKKCVKSSACIAIHMHLHCDTDFEQDDKN